MKTITTLAASLIAAATIAGSGTAVEPDRASAAIGTRDTYNVTISLEVPYLKSGTRSYASQKLTGKMYLVYDENGGLYSTEFDVVNKKTGVKHNFFQAADEGLFCNFMGKSAKRTRRATPTFWSTSSDLRDIYDEANVGISAHEFVELVAFAAKGTGKLIKSKTTSCNVCGDNVTTTGYCYKPYKFTGSVVGYMNCDCPDEEEGWDHTLVGSTCGPLANGDEYIRDHNASFRGTWSAVLKSYNEAYEIQ